MALQEAVRDVLSVNVSLCYKKGGGGGGGKEGREHKENEKGKKGEKSPM